MYIKTIKIPEQEILEANYMAVQVVKEVKKQKNPHLLNMVFHEVQEKPMGLKEVYLLETIQKILTF